jgi:hypothetical protein
MRRIKLKMELEREAPVKTNGGERLQIQARLS